MSQPPVVHVDRISFRESGQFAARDVAYAEHDERLRPFMAHAPELASFADAIAARQAFTAYNPQPLVTALREQYTDYGIDQTERIDALLSADTFTVTTAHQASLFLGPLYYVYKILSAAKLSRQLAEAHPQYTFIPMFVLGAEDHDLDEIDHLRLGGKTIRWSTDQTGSTGEMQLTGIEEALTKVRAELGPSTSGRELAQLLTRCYQPTRSLGEATAHFVAELFGEYGILVARLGHPALKAQFAGYMARELTGESQPLVAATQKQLDAAGFASQAHARDINLFYLQPGRRDRIVTTPDGGYKVLDTKLTWTREQALAELKAHPERFSPNVVTRPLLQELSLPNLAYVGGGGELAYWLERKSQFAHFALPFPVLVRRDSALWVSQGASRTLAKLDLTYRDLLSDEHELMRRYVTERAGVNVGLQTEMAQVKAAFAELAARALSIDPSLEKRALAHSARAENSVADLEKRFVRALKRQQETSIDRITKVRAELLPGGGLQERTDSFMNLYRVSGQDFFDILLKHFDPLDMRLKVFVEPAEASAEIPEETATAQAD